jgi:hypothetical protein
VNKKKNKKMTDKEFKKFKELIRNSNFFLGLIGICPKMFALPVGYFGRTSVSSPFK